MKKWQQQWKNTPTGHTYQSIQPNTQRRARQYSSNRKKDVIFTRLRLGHNRLKFHRKYNIGDGLCTRCNNQNYESIDHVLFDCQANQSARRELETTMLKLGNSNVTLKNLLSPSPTHTESVVAALMKFLKDTEYMDII